MTKQEQTAHAVEYYPSADVWVEEGGKVFLVGSRCPKCGTYAFPPATFCSKCGNTEGLARTRLSDSGVLYSFSEVQVAPKGLGVRAPYTVGYVDFPEGVRVFGQVEHTAAELRVDEQVRVVLGVIREPEGGPPIISYKFRKKGE